MRYLITGGSGYIGGRLSEELAGRDETEAIVNVDVRPPAGSHEKSTYVHADVRDSARLRALLDAERIDVLIHLAFILNPIRDEARMYDVDVNGTQAVLQAASEAGTEHVLVTSSGVAYGAFPDNPVPIAEDQPVRGSPDFAYARDKTEADRLCQLWALEHPDRVMTIVRPTIVFGPNVDNYLVRAWTANPVVLILDGVDSGDQFVHEDDVVSALVGLLDAKAPGAFNVAGDGTVPRSETAALIGKRVRHGSLRMNKRILRLLWALRMPRLEAPPGSLDFLRYPWVLSNEKLKATIGWEPRYDSRETFVATMQAKGLLAEDGREWALLGSNQ